MKAQLIKQKNFNTKKKFGQNFLKDSFYKQQIYAAINIKPSDNVVEIGPGHGDLTALIYDASSTTLIEIDTDLIPNLKKQFPDANIINKNILNVSLSSLSKNEIKQNKEQSVKAKLIGNLPYYISAEILFWTIANIDYVKDAHFMLQQEVVDRICANPNNKTYGRLSVMLQYFFKVEKLFTVPSIAFTPIPKVNSAFLRLTPLSREFVALDIKIFTEIVKFSFAKKRKTIFNNLKFILSKQDLLNLSIEPSSRAESLQIVDFIRLSNSITNGGKLKSAKF